MAGKNISEDLIVAANQKVKEREYWLETLSGELGSSGFPHDYIDNADKEDDKKDCGKHFETKEFQLGASIFSRIMELSRGNYHTVHMILLAALNVLVYKYTGGKDIILVTPIYGQDIETSLIINTVLLVRNKFSENTSFKELLIQVRKKYWRRLNIIAILSKSCWITWVQHPPRRGAVSRILWYGSIIFTKGSTWTILIPIYVFYFQVKKIA